MAGRNFTVEKQLGGDISIAEAARRLRRRIRPIVVAALLGGVFGLAAGFVFRDVYRREALLIPQKSDGDSSLSSIARRFSGLASVAGVPLPGSGEPESAAALASLSSYGTLSAFIRQKDIAEQLVRGAHCENRLVCLLPSPPVTEWRAVKVLQEHSRVSTGKSDGLVRVTVEWFDPATATKFTNDLVRFADARLRADAKATAKARIRFLEQESDRASVVGVRETIANVMDSEMRRLTMAGADSEFAFRVIDPAVNAEKPVRPRRLLLIVAFAFLASMLVSVHALLAPEA